MIRQLTNDEIIDVRDGLLAKGDAPSLSVHDQNLLRDCDIALGLVRCKPETREEAVGRVSRSVHAAAVRLDFDVTELPEVKPHPTPSGKGLDRSLEDFCADPFEDM